MVLRTLCQNRNGVHGCEEYDEFERQLFRCIASPCRFCLSPPITDARSVWIREPRNVLALAPLVSLSS